MGSKTLSKNTCFSHAHIGQARFEWCFNWHAHTLYVSHSRTCAQMFPTTFTKEGSTSPCVSKWDLCWLYTFWGCRRERKWERGILCSRSMSLAKASLAAFSRSILGEVNNHWVVECWNYVLLCVRVTIWRNFHQVSSSEFTLIQLTSMRFSSHI